MNDHPDVLIVGTGAAGFAAAVAARKHGASVQLVHAGVSATALGGGAWDVAPLLGSTSIQEAVERVCARRAHHPFARLAREALTRIEEAHAAVLGALGGYRSLVLDGPGTVSATDLGLMRRSASTQTAVLALGDRDTRVAVATFTQLQNWDAKFVAASLQQTTDEREFSATAPIDLEAHDAIGLAHWVDTEAGRIQLAEALKAALLHTHYDALLLPPIAGIEREDACPQLAEHLGVAVGEVQAPLCGAQGLRLQHRIAQGLAQLGCDVASRRVHRVHMASGAPRVLFADGQLLEPKAVVLATGKRIGGGIAYNGCTLHDPVARLAIYREGRPQPLPSSSEGADPTELFGVSPFEAGPGSAAGLGYDQAFRPLDEEGNPVSERLFAAGAVLEGFDPVHDGTGLGCAVTTGFIAGTHAAQAS